MKYNICKFHKWTLSWSYMKFGIFYILYKNLVTDILDLNMENFKFLIRKKIYFYFCFKYGIFYISHLKT